MWIKKSRLIISLTPFGRNVLYTGTVLALEVFVNIRAKNSFQANINAITVVAINPGAERGRITLKKQEVLF